MKKFILSVMAAVGCAAVANAVVADRLWIIGEPAGAWDPTVGVELKKVSDGVFEYDGVFTAEKTSFGFVDQLAAAGDWDGLNSHRYVAPASGTVPVDGPNPMEYGTSDAAWDLPAGSYHMTIDTNEMVLTLGNGGGEPPVVVAPTLYFLGEVNDWKSSDDYQFTTDDEGKTYVFKASVLRSSEDCTFKIATSNWSTEYSNGNQKMEAGNTYPIGPGKGVENMGFAEDINNAELILDTEAMTLTVNGNGKMSGVNGLESESEAVAEYYTLQGVRVENPSAGLYIERKAGSVRKVVIR